MADNATPTGSGVTVATDKVTYSGDTADIQLTRAVKTSGTEGTRVVGSLTYHVVSAATTNAANIKSSSGELQSVRCFNNTTYPVFIKFYDKATSPTVGSDTIKMTIGVQAGTDRDVVFPGGLLFATGISVAILKDIALAGTTAVAVSDCSLTVEYT